MFILLDEYGVEASKLCLTNIYIDRFIKKSWKRVLQKTLREWKVSKYGVFLVRILLYSVRIQEITDQKKLCTWRIFTQWKVIYRTEFIIEPLTKCTFEFEIEG